MDDLKMWFLNNFDRNRSYKGREMKRVFQWRRYFEWNDLTTQEKLTAKRILLIPILAFPLLAIIRAYTSIIVVALIIWLLYRKFEKGTITK